MKSVGGRVAVFLGGSLEDHVLSVTVLGRNALITLLGLLSYGKL